MYFILQIIHLFKRNLTAYDVCENEGIREKYLKYPD